MLADGGAIGPIAKGLHEGLHLPATQFRKLIGWIAELLPSWRDSVKAFQLVAEDDLSDDLCGFLEDNARNTPGPEAFKFLRETRDEINRRGKIDITVKPSNCEIWIEARHYSPRQIFLPIECKRLPTPSGKKRDPREYVVSNKSSTGGIQRFKLGQHGAAHGVAAMIGYVQQHNIPHWQSQIGTWIDGLEEAETEHWSQSDHLSLESHDKTNRCATFRSSHVRAGEWADLEMSHLWIEM